MKYKYTTHCSKNVLRSIREFLKTNMNKYNVNEYEQNLIILAVDEVCSNLIIHTHDCNEKEHFSIELDITKKDMLVKIVDSSEGFNINSYVEPNVDKLFEDKRKGGLGLILVRKIMNKIECIKKKEKHIYKLYKEFEKT